MPHFVIDCSEPVLSLQPAERILREVHNAAEATGLFARADIKVRIHPYGLSSVAGTSGDFIHVFAGIMQGRSEQQKRDLSLRVVRALTALFPEVPVISMNVDDFDRATYCNRAMI
jgi:5-carboxymethyl-2-hydroxymuconate isomerase